MNVGPAGPYTCLYQVEPYLRNVVEPAGTLAAFLQGGLRMSQIDAENASVRTAIASGANEVSHSQWNAEVIYCG